MASAIRFCSAPDGAKLAYARDGAGPPLVRTAFYLNHLEYDWECPVWKPYLQLLSRRHTLIRHDLRGFGLSDREPAEMSLDAWVGDLEAVVDHAGLERFPLFAVCQGGPMAIEYAARHPERVSHIVLFGSFARGVLKRNPSAAELEELKVMRRLVELGWGRDNEAFQQVWSALFQPKSSAERLRSLAQLQSRSSTSEMVIKLLRTVATLDVTESAKRVQCPTLVLHPKRSRAAPFEEGRLLASLIPNARLVPLDSENHVLTEEEPAWSVFVAELERFLPHGPAQFPGLSARETQILERIAQGLDNAQIAAHLGLAEKTVKNHITRIFVKIGVENRPQAIVKARSAGLGAVPAD
jgi:pimeloyl-ACP methyl ester carboxylesterase/DNA-binding CsgD family transcriptional regulator